MKRIESEYGMPSVKFLRSNGSLFSHCTPATVTVKKLIRNKAKWRRIFGSFNEYSNSFDIVMKRVTDRKVVKFSLKRNKKSFENDSQFGCALKA